MGISARIGKGRLPPTGTVCCIYSLQKNPNITGDVLLGFCKKNVGHIFYLQFLQSI